jgi:hemerythrin-like domain-containing protein
MSANLPSATSIKEAAERQLEYDPKVRANYIRTMVKDITQMMAEGETEESIRNRVPDFVEQYPELFKKMIKKEDITIMYDMLRLLDKMGEGKLSQHTASVAIGQSLVERFVTPQLKGKQ